MIIYRSRYNGNTECSELILFTDSQSDDHLKMSLFLSISDDWVINELKTLNDSMIIPISTIKEICKKNDDNDAVNFVKLFFTEYFIFNIKFQIDVETLYAIIGDNKIVVIGNKLQMEEFRTSIITYCGNENENILNKTETDENINNIIKKCTSMEVPLFKCGTVILVKDINTYNQITNLFNFPKIDYCLGTMETLCSENKRYYVLGVFNDSLTTFVHELTHLAFHIYRDTSMKIESGENNETFAYLVDYFFQEWQHLFTNRCD